MAVEHLRWKRLQSDLNFTQKAILACLCDRAGGVDHDYPDCAWPSRADLAEDASAGISTVQRTLNDLERLRCIERVGSVSQVTVWRICLERRPPSEQAQSGLPPGPERATTRPRAGYHQARSGLPPGPERADLDTATSNSPGPERATTRPGAGHHQARSGPPPGPERATEPEGTRKNQKRTRILGDAPSFDASPTPALQLPDPPDHPDAVDLWDEPPLPRTPTTDPTSLDNGPDHGPGEEVDQPSAVDPPAAAPARPAKPRRRRPPEETANPERALAVELCTALVETLRAKGLTILTERANVECSLRLLRQVGEAEFRRAIANAAAMDAGDWPLEGGLPMCLSNTGFSRLLNAEAGRRGRRGYTTEPSAYEPTAPLPQLTPEESAELAAMLAEWDQYGRQPVRREEPDAPDPPAEDDGLGPLTVRDPVRNRDRWTRNGR